MSDEFNKIENYAGWKAKLEELIATAEKASRNNDDDARLSVAERLSQFVLTSSPNSAAIRALDEIATTAAHQLSTAVVTGTVDRIAARTAALRLLAKQLEVAAEQAEKAAASIRLEKAHKLVDALTGAIRAVDELGGLLTEGSDEDLRERLVKLGHAMEALRTEVDNA